MLKRQPRSLNCLVSLVLIALVAQQPDHLTFLPGIGLGIGLIRWLAFPSLLRQQSKSAESQPHVEEECLRIASPSGNSPKLIVKGCSIMEATSATSASIAGEMIFNTDIPMHFCLVVAKSRTTIDHVHWGVLLRGSFSFRNQTYTHILAERFKKCIMIRFFEGKHEAIEKLCNIAFDDDELIYTSRTNEFQSTVSADTIVDYIRQDLCKDFKFDTSVKDGTSTNCALFSLYAALMLCNPEDNQRIINQCNEAEENPGHWYRHRL